MIGRVYGAVAGLFVYGCIATVMAQMLIVATLWNVWGLDRDKVVYMLAIAQGVDLFSIKEEVDVQQDALSPEQVSYEQIIKERAIKVRHLELRKDAIDRGLAQLQFERQKLGDDMKLRAQLADRFDEKLAAVREEARAAGTEEARVTLEAIKPKQAKDQLIMMYDDDQVDAVVFLLATMPVKKRAKIIAQFTTEEDEEKLAVILRRIREGFPDALLVDKAQAKLEKPNRKKG